MTYDSVTFRQYSNDKTPENGNNYHRKNLNDREILNDLRITNYFVPKFHLQRKEGGSVGQYSSRTFRSMEMSHTIFQTLYFHGVSALDRSHDFFGAVVTNYSSTGKNGIFGQQ